MNKPEDISAHLHHLDSVSDNSANASLPEKNVFHTESLDNSKCVFASFLDSAVMSALTSSNNPTSYRYNDDFFFEFLIEEVCSRVSNEGLKQN